MGFKKITIFGINRTDRKFILKKLINDNYFNSINVVSRKEINLKSDKINQIVNKKFSDDIIESSVRGSEIVFPQFEQLNQESIIIE